MKLIRRVRRRRRDIATLKGILEGAEKHASGRGDERVGAEHMLLAALDLPEDTAHQAFVAVGADSAEFAGAISAQHAQALDDVGVSPGLDPETTSAPVKRVSTFDATFEAAIQAAYRAHEKGGSLCGAHIVAGVCAVEHGVAARAFDAMGVSREQLSEAAVATAASRDDDL